MQSNPTPNTPVVMEKTSKAARRVSFDKAEIVSTVTACSSMSPEERREIWYPASDLDAMRTAARELCRQARVAPWCGDDVRGLEHRVCLERQKHKFLAIRCILRAQQKLNNPEYIAIVARKCTAWAKEVALVTAQNDCLAISCPTEIATSIDPSLSRKRQNEVPLEAQRCVKRRTEPLLVC